ncbi:MAG: DUF362 domain-containing protein [Acidobacteria bacterium]|nr:DUF362 domain-containing protein [Acidobacteriota bacterium]
MKVASPTLAPPFNRPPSRVAIRRASGYDTDLEALLSETLAEFDINVRGATVLLKPNFVEPDPRGVVNTHPAVVRAARECFLQLGAKSVLIGEGPAQERDTWAVLDSMRATDYLGRLHNTFVDLNLDDIHPLPLRTHASRLRELYLPRTVLNADFIVSMPKLKTHHWAGVTLSLKNMFGVIPGSCYGWPKNVLHWAGISNSILDINSTVRPHFAIVDGIMGMEGNGPLQGSPKYCGVLVAGDDPVAVDATCARVMDLVPQRIDYMAKAGALLGHIEELKIEQIGEHIANVRTPFEVVESFRRIQASH